MLVGNASHARALALYLELEGREQAQLEDILMDENEPLEQFEVDPSGQAPLLVRSGSKFTHLPFLRSGAIVPWQLPRSELNAPFLLGEHEFLANETRWVASYSAVPPAHGILLPKEVMCRVVHLIPSAQERMQKSVMRRLSRFYWTSLTTSGTPASRVAAALVSQLASYGEDYDEEGKEKIIRISQKDLERLTMTSRSVVAVGLKTLTENRSTIRFGDAETRKDYERAAREVGARENRPAKSHESRFYGVIIVPDVDRLKDVASEEGNKIVGRSLPQSSSRYVDA